MRMSSILGSLRLVRRVFTRSILDSLLMAGNKGSAANTGNTGSAAKPARSANDNLLVRSSDANPALDEHPPCGKTDMSMLLPTHLHVDCLKDSPSPGFANVAKKQVTNTSPKSCWKTGPWMWLRFQLQLLLPILTLTPWSLRL
jgi:hypothetical protein